jgi:hypothetical protein
LTITALDGANVEQRLVSAQIDCDDDPARVYRTEPAANLRGKDSSRILAALVNRERVAAALPALRGELRANVAAARRLVEHSDAETALREAALVPLKQGSVAFHVDSIEEAAELLLDDPTLHTMVLRHDVSHIGVATAADPGGGLSIALQLLEISPVIDRGGLTTRIRASLERPPEQHLQLIASWYASQLALGWDPSALDDEMHWKLNEARLQAVQLEVWTLDHLEDFDPAVLARGHRQRYAGVNVVQAPRNGALVGRTIVVVLFGNPPPRRR